MARIWVDGFESRSLDMYEGDKEYTGFNQNTTDDWSGMYYFGIGWNNFLVKSLMSDYSELYFKFRFKNSSQVGFFKTKDNTNNVCLSVGFYNSKLRVYSGDFSTAISTGEKTLQTDKIYLIEIRYKPHNISGIIQIKVDGVMDIDFSGDTTGGDEHIRKVLIGSLGGTYVYFDDFVIDDSDWIGNSRIQAIAPIGAGNSTQFTPSSGSNYQCVDEIPVVDTDYIYTNTIGNKDTYSFGNLSGNIASIKSVSAMARLGYNGEPSPRNVRIIARVGTTDYESSDIPVPLSFDEDVYIWDNNPNTSSEWSETDVNGAEFGIKAVA